jgi:GGDEF domain-containing protein
MVLPYDALSNAAILAIAPSVADGPGVVIRLVVPLVAIGRMTHLSGETERQGRVDSITGLLSRTALTSAVRDMRVDRLGRLSAGPLYALYMIDLDQFEPINDTFGHDAGDHVLMTVGRRMAALLSPGGARAFAKLWSSPSHSTKQL